MKNKIKIAIIDSGIDSKHPALKGSIKGGVEIYLDEDGKIKYGKNYSDVHGHGTAIAGIIKKTCPDVELYSVKILDGELKSYGILLIESIKWCLKNKMKVINLSLGTENKKWKEKLQKICDEAYNKGIIIVAALLNKKESYPAILSNVIGVISENNKKEKVAWINRKNKFVRITPSFATAKITGIIAKHLLKEPSLNFNIIKNIITRKEKI